MSSLLMVAMLVLVPNTAFADDGSGGAGVFLLLFLIAIGTAIVGIYKHVKGEITIYTDYTDASVTVAGVIIPGIVHILGKMIFGENIVPFILALLVFLCGLCIVIKHTRYFNISRGGFFLALFTKYCVTFLFVFAIAALIFGAGSSRKKGESSYAFELRRQRESLNNTMLIVALTAALTYLSHLMTRGREFVSLDDYLANTRNEYKDAVDVDDRIEEDTSVAAEVVAPVTIPVLPENVEFSCPKCELSGRVPLSKLPLAGAHATCPKCQERFFVSNPAAPAMA